VSHGTDSGDIDKERRMRISWCLLALLALAGAAVLPAVAEKEKDVKKDTRYFEMRTYYAAPGKMDALNARFREHTNALFKKHGMEIVGFWTDVNKPDDLVYILAYPSKEAREKSWKEFGEDPEWVKVKKETEKDGKLVEKVDQKFLTPTDYSPIK
jgi:hypothetical protein